jgi:hypothetical protein
MTEEIIGMTEEIIGITKKAVRMSRWLLHDLRAALVATCSVAEQSLRCDCIRTRQTQGKHSSQARGIAVATSAANG